MKNNRKTNKTISEFKEFIANYWYFDCCRMHLFDVEILGTFKKDNE